MVQKYLQILYITSTVSCQTWTSRYSQSHSHQDIHWNIYVLGDQGYFHFNSMVTLAYTPTLRNVYTLKKMRCARKVYNEQSKNWLEVRSSHSWIKTNMPQKNSGWTCGYYMLKNIVEFSKVLKHRLHILCEVNKAKTKSHLKYRPLKKINKKNPFLFFNICSNIICNLQGFTLNYTRREAIRTKTVIINAMIDVVQVGMHKKTKQNIKVVMQKPEQPSMTKSQSEEEG